MKPSTKPIIALSLAATLLAVAGVAQTVKQISVKSMPPSVIKTIPASGTTDVDPTLRQLTFVFSKDMIDRNWSVCQISKETFPAAGEGGMHYLPDKRTCLMPVKLEPGKTYVLWLNRAQFQSFRDTDNNSSVPYLLVFQTRN
jgi:RNA polymerase sigma-70 factor (ECF subfamily)